MVKRFKGSYYGFLIGDAMGVPIEFEDRKTLLENPVVDMKGYGSYDVPKGSWSDDSSMMLATMDSIMASNGVDYNDMMTKFSEWISFSKYTSVGEVFDIGRTTLKAISRFQNGAGALESGLKGENYNGNGSLMRMVPIAFYAYCNELSENEIISLVCDSSSLTHGHDISLLGCYIYVRYVIFLLSGYDKFESYMLIKNLDYSFVSIEARNAYSRLLDDDITNYSLEDIYSTGYVVYSLEAVIWCVCNTDNFEQAIIGSINLGNDTDTIGALTGSLAGIIYGIDNIPNKWLNSLQKIDYLKLMYTSFVKTLNNLG